jgi:hypothetical protein
MLRDRGRESVEVDGLAEPDVVVNRLRIPEVGEGRDQPAAVETVVHDEHAAADERGQPGVDGQGPGPVEEADLELCGGKGDGGEQARPEAGRELLELGLPVAELDVEEVLADGGVEVDRSRVEEHLLATIEDHRCWR